MQMHETDPQSKKATSAKAKSTAGVKLTQPASSSSETWSQVLYSEAWKQYIHEDNLLANRTGTFMQLNIGLLTALALTGAFTARAKLTLGSHTIYIGVLALCIGVILCSFFIFPVLTYWQKVTTSSRGYLSLRWVTARALEIEKGLPLGPATLETVWRDASKDHAPGERIKPFTAMQTIAELELPANIPGAGFAAVEMLVSRFRTGWIALLSCAVLTAFITFGYAAIPGTMQPVVGSSRVRESVATDPLNTPTHLGRETVHGKNSTSENRPKPSNN